MRRISESERVFLELERLIFFLIEMNIKLRSKKAYEVQKLY